MAHHQIPENADPFESHLDTQSNSSNKRSLARTHAQHRHFVKSSFNAIKQSFFPITFLLHALETYTTRMWCCVGTCIMLVFAASTYNIIHVLKSASLSSVHAGSSLFIFAFFFFLNRS